MIRKIVLENYMAHVRTVIEPAQGLTVLIGPNNCGKSAIIHALEMICYNSDAADYAIRHGTKKAVVTIETQDDDGVLHTITWWRKEKTAGYVIDGREISGLGKGKIPDDLHQHLRMPMIESAAGGNEFLLHFGLQKSPIFLLDDPASRAAQFFASATDADKLVQMQKVHQQKVTYAKRDKEKLDSELEHLDQQLEALTPLAELSHRISALEDEHGKLTDIGTSLGALNGCVQGLDQAGKSAAISATQIDTLSFLQKPPVLQDTRIIREWINATECYLNETARNHARGQVLQPLNKVPELAKTDRLRQLCDDIDGASRRTAVEGGRAGALAQLGSPPNPHDLAALKSAIGSIRKFFDRQANCHYRVAILAALAEPPSLHDTDDLKRRINQIADAIKVRSRLETQAKLFLRLTPPPEPTNPGPLRDSINQIDSAARVESKCFSDLQKTDGQIEQFRREIQEWVKKNPRCNACGQAITADLITSGGHRHE